MKTWLTWCAVIGKPPKQVLKEAKLVETGFRTTLPTARWSAASLASGWFVLVSNPCMYLLQDPKFLIPISSDAEAISFHVGIGPTICSTAYWRDGNEIWRVHHHPEHDKSDLHITGVLPDALAESLADAVLKQLQDGSEMHVLDVPLDWGMRTCGFRHDIRPTSEDDPPYQVVYDIHDRRNAKDPPFWDLSLILEGKRPICSPRGSEIRKAIRKFTPFGGPGFVILDHSGKDYAQVAGGNGRYMAEWRVYNGDQFRHLTAGIPDRPKGELAHVETNCNFVEVYENEVLSAEDAQAILLGFAKNEIPTQFAWRDVTDSFG